MEELAVTLTRATRVQTRRWVIVSHTHHPRSSGQSIEVRNVNWRSWHDWWLILSRKVEETQWKP